jgi:triacylglycerol lipase
MKLLIAIALLLSQSLVYAQECVILLHGLGRSTWSMRQMENALHKQNYIVINQNYLSREKSIPELADIVGESLALCDKTQPEAIHFVTHSLGGILVRAYFNQHPPHPLVKRIVMLGAPNHGSEVVDKFKNSWWFKWMTGPAGQQLGTDNNAFVRSLRPLPFDVGIVAGNSSSDPWFAALFSGANDGKVSVESTKLPEMKDFIQVENGHTFMANSRNVINQVTAFLATGHFMQNQNVASRK